MSPSDPNSAAGPADGLPLTAPDVVEQDIGSKMDNIVPSHGYDLAPMVGIGGSAGAIRALQVFFERMPADSGMVFVVILHLSPDHVSMMAEMIQKWTAMCVVQASDGEAVQPNWVYVIPPGKQLMATDGHLSLTDLSREPGRRVAVDLFFRSLADTHGPHAAAIVLSGADGDGTLGIKRIKERGGLTIAQDPGEAEHDSMPRAAIATGMVDWVLEVANMPQRIVDYVNRERRLTLPPEEGPHPAEAPSVAPSAAEAALREILVHLRMRTGRDFTYYKRATILRRISRRMQVNGVEDTPAYLAFLRSHPGEAGALLKDLLISVTNFFRDRDVFAALAKRIPDLFAGKGRGDFVRVWVPGCATGEEAYSIALLLLEHASTLDVAPAIQVFGCDLDQDAVQVARVGLFPSAITADVSEQRLRRFFVKEHQGYRIRREVREVVLFAAHDLLKDAPFSRVDLISCRNLLIYLNREAQTRALEIFHFALRSDGLLLLGASESIDESNRLFQLLDKKHRLFVRKSSTRVSLPVPIGPSTLLVQQIEGQVAIERAKVPPPRPTPGPTFPPVNSLAFTSAPASASGKEDLVSRSELHFKLLEHFGPPSLLVDRNHEIQHISQTAGRFLQVSPGEPTTNVMRLINPALRAELRSVLFRASQTQQLSESLRVPIELEGKPHEVDLRAIPANDVAPDFLLITVEARDPSGPLAAPSEPSSLHREPMIQHLERELEHMKSHLRDTVEQYEASTEELKSSNEELQAMNEELRSATEELETSREELQSINEELVTVNQELKEKVEELAHANSDLQNLMGATAIATLFLDREMRIMRFTDSAVPIFNLIAADVGRPLSDLQHQVDYPEMSADAAHVLSTLTRTERQVTGSGQRHYLARMLPYRTVDDRIAGVVLTFVDITERHHAQETLRENVEELSRFNSVAVGRESRMIDLKKEINALCAKLGEEPRYPLDFEPKDRRTP